jgi:vacuolar-type H+-ATPase subunit H
VPPLRDFLSRFRPAGAPGAAARAGLPVDRERELEAEVIPVLALLDGTRDDCAAIVGRARRDADKIVASARTEATAIEADGGRRAGAARDEATRRLVGAAAADAAAMVAAAQREQARIGELAGARMPSVVSLAVTEIWRLAMDGRPWNGERAEDR